MNQTTTRRSFMQTAAATLTVSATLAAPTLAHADAHPDAELLRLGEELDRSWRAQRATEAAWNREGYHASDEEVDALVDETGRIVEQIMKQPATTLEGLKVKARAVSWCADGYLSKPEDHETLDVRLAMSMVYNLLDLQPGL